MTKTETETEVTYTGVGFTLTIKKDNDILDVHEIIDLSVVTTSQTYQDLITYLDTKL